MSTGLLLALTAALAPLAQEEAKSERVVVDRERYGPLVMQLAPPSAPEQTPFLILLHESRSSRGEYQPILPRLHELGYVTLNVDLSSGLECREVKNLTARRAAEAGRAPTYLDAQRDIADAVLWARANRAHGKLVLVGSGYSAALALIHAAEHPDLVDGVAAFSPGEVFESLGKPATWVRDSARSLEAPVWLTSARAEEKDWRAMYDALASPKKAWFLPEGPGTHGARALWPESTASEHYRAAFERFLKEQFPPPAAAPEAPTGG
jgi:dienelactone hydrolase